MRAIFVLALLCPLLSMCQPITLTLSITNEQAAPVAGATITLTRTGFATATGSNGEATLTGLRLGDTLVVSAVGYQTRTEVIDYTLRNRLTIVLQRKTTALDDVVVIAYGTTTRRFNTGSVSRITASDIATQPVYNPLSALQGLVPGLVVTQRTGLPGSNYNVQVRGTNSLKQGTQLLFIIDGVPVMLNSGSLSQLLPDVQSIFNTINPADIESIEVLKDADATAIYGSQGANGVVLITTKKGRAGVPQFSLDAYSGFGRVGRKVPLLKTPQYLQMRREAFANDNRTITASAAPDLLVWDTTASINWTSELIGGTAHTANYQASLSGGTASVSYQLSANYVSESTVFPQPRPNTRSSGRMSLTHTSPAQRWSATVTALYAVDKKDLPFTDLATAILLPPNAPPLFDSAGNLRWTAGIDNPLAFLRETYQTQMANFIANASIKYQVLQNLSLRLNMGYNAIGLDEQKQTPIAAQRPSASTTGTLRLTIGNTRSWLAEPQLHYTLTGRHHTVELLTGASLQQREQTMTSVQGTGYTSDDLVGTLGGAATLAASNSYSQYKYAAFFSRVTCQYNHRYILNGSLRRDGSSRYGPASRFATFGAIGAAWVFSETALLKNSSISYGKLRASYGTTGNDQVGDYQFFDSWSTSTTYNYNGSPGILPARLFNPVYQWEKNKKIEAALEWGFLQNNLLLTVAAYRNRSASQLVFYKLPSQTGFTSVLRNIDAVIQNSGVEVELTAKIIRHRSFAWQTSLNMSAPRNKLLRYPGLETSADRLIYALGQPLNSIRTYHYTGVDPTTGIYTFVDVDGDGKISSPNDLTNIVALGPSILGGWQNSFSAGPWQCTMLWYGVHQTGYNALTNLTAAPGLLRNQPQWVLNHWQKAGDGAEGQLYTSIATSAAASAFNRYRASSALVGDASFIRLRNLSVAYNLPAALLGKAKLQGLRIYAEGQNLLTVTGYKGADPETQNLLSLPPLRVLALGIQLTF